ncbi:MAG: carboxypeptidase regulatory-like domain-containing protein, partial [Phycisphaeraceae bacterium]|nr:carboxypeptidase regulatory-like domain-containing protein [Phycisphaeraceae bacterium]
MKNAVLIFGVCCTLLIAGCKKDGSGSEPSGGINVSGTVQAFGGQAISGAAVQCYAGTAVAGSPAASGTSNASGVWQVAVNAAGRYTVVISAAGRPTAYIDVVIPLGQTSVAAGTTILAAQQITGTVNDAQTGSAISGATVRFFVGSGNDTSAFRFPDLTTDSQGRFTTSLTIGNYVYVIHAAGRVPLVANRSVT